MDKLEAIYDRITFLRKRKVSMKDMARACNMYQSVFSAIYTTVIPHYLDGIRKGYTPEFAIKEALSWVNNVSKKRFYTAVNDMYSALTAMEPPTLSVHDEDKSNPFLSFLFHSAKESPRLIGDYTGIYESYSMSSIQRAMKVEPYIIINEGEYVKVGHKNIFGKIHWGCAIINETNHLYIMFNELQSPRLALYTISLKIPRFVHTDFMRGIYLSMDYNDTPIARRILFIKRYKKIDMNLFNSLKSRLIYPDHLADKEQLYYDYTCQGRDVIRMKNIENPQISIEDLTQEKSDLDG